MLDIIRKHLADLAASNWDGYKAALADNVIYEELATKLRARGRDEYVTAVKRWKKAFPDLKATVKNSVTSGEVAMVELEWEGTHGGPLESPFGTFAATNKKGHVRAVLAMKIVDNKIVESRHYFDLLTVIAQLGLAPTIGAPPPAKPAAAPKHT